MNAQTAKLAIAHGSIQTPSLRQQLMRSAGIASEPGDTPLVGTGGMVGGLANTVEKLLRAHELMTRLHGERWPAMSAPWKRIIAAKAAKENLSDMAAAVALAKEAPMPAQSLLILAAAVEMKTPNIKLSHGPAGPLAGASGSVYVMHAYVRGERREILETLSPAMWECLYNACWKNAPRRGKATMAALEARGLLKDGKITVAGIDAQLVEWRNPSPNTKGSRAEERE